MAWYQVSFFLFFLFFFPPRNDIDGDAFGQFMGNSMYEGEVQNKFMLRGNCSV